MTLGSSVQEEDRPLEFLEQVHLLRERVEALTEAPLPSAVALSVAPRAADFLRDHWAAVTLGALGDAPVPRVGCCLGCGQQGEGPGGESETVQAAGTDGTDGNEGVDPGRPEPSPLRQCLSVGLALLIWSAAAYWGVCLLAEESTGLTAPVVELATAVHAQTQRTTEVLLRSVEDLFTQMASFLQTVSEP